MAELVEGQRYGLSSNTESDKTIIHLKLTDSALKTLEEYAKQKDEHRKASIRFPQGSSNGSIQIPTRKGENNTRTFQFTLSSIQGDLNGSFDCLEQTNSRYHSQVNALGCMTQKIVVHATDDVYKTTKERMTLAEEENKKVCTKEIKPSGPFMRRVYKKVNKNGILPPKVSSTLSQSSWSSHGSHHGNHHPNSGSLASHNGVSSHNGSSAFSNNTRVPSPQAFSGFSQSANNGRRGPANEPLRDRVIHLLAMRPYNKPELILRLKKDGQVDKDSLGALMEEVATQYKENKYTLAKSMYSEVRLDWPYYTEGERQLVRRRIATDGRSASNSPEESSPQYSNIPNNGSPYNLNNAQKRGPSADTQAAKKMRVSPTALIEKQQNGVALKKPAVRIPGLAQPPPPPPPVITPHNNNNNHHHPHHPHSVTHSHLMNGLSSSRSSDSTHNNHFGNSHLGANAQSKNNLTAVTTKTEEVPSPSSSPDSDGLNYLTKYSVICGDSQRQEYKEDFNIEFLEYQKLYQDISKVSQKFLDMDSQMKKISKGSPAYEKLERKIVHEYHQTKKNTKFLQTKNRFGFLHRKLGYIKKLVVDYDQKQMATVKAS